MLKDNDLVAISRFIPETENERRLEKRKREAVRDNRLELTYRNHAVARKHGKRKDRTKRNAKKEKNKGRKKRKRALE